MEEQIAKRVDKYLGMMPSDVGCKNWFIMRLNMIEEIKQLQLYNVVGQSEQLVSFLLQYQKSCEIMHVNKIDAKNFVEQYKTK